MNKTEQGILYVAATPIGNLGDVSDRLKQVLRDADWIAAEDTRISQKLLQALDIQTKLISFHAHSGPGRVRDLAARLAAGDTGVLVSDAGTPAVSDPGADLVAAVVAQGGTVRPVPGPSAVTALASVSGYPGAELHFYGFFPRKTKQREELLQRMSGSPGLHVFFESPTRITAVLEVVAGFAPDAAVILGRELTKKFEEIRRGSAAELAAEWSRSGVAKGELVCGLVFPEGGRVEAHSVAAVRGLLEDLAQMGVGRKALLAVGRFHGLSREEIYRIGVAHKPES